MEANIYITLFLLLSSLAAGHLRDLPPGVKIKVLDRTRGNILLGAEVQEGLDKEQIEQNIQTYIASNFTLGGEPDPISIASVVYKYYSASGTQPWNGSYVRTYYNNRAAYNDWDRGYVSVTVNGDTVTVWSGLNPYYSDAIDLAERWSFSGLSVTVSFPPGISWSGGGSTVSFDSGWVNTAGWAYRLENIFSGVYAKSLLDIWRVDDSATRSHRFGSTIVTAIANGGASVP